MENPRKRLRDDSGEQDRTSEQTFEEKKLKAKAISSKYHVRESERADFVEPVRERKKASKESGDIGWDEVFARRSKRSNEELYASKN